MSSVIKVNTVQDADGNNIINESGDVITVGAAGDTVTVAGNVVKSNALQASDAGNIVSQSGTTITIGASGDTVALASGASQTGFGSNPFKNIIINGDMSIAQRGTSFTGLGDADSKYTLDRFKWSEEGSSGTAEFTITQSTDVPTGQGFATSLKLDCTTADTSIDSGNIIYIEQRVEGQNLQYLKYGTSSAESTTLSFWVKSNKTGTYTVNALGDVAGSGKLYSQAYTISSANTWEKKTLTFIGDTALAINNNSSNGLQLMWNLLAGTDKSSGSVQTWGSNTQANRAPGQVNLADSTSNELYITGIQWEAGTSATDFEHLPFDINLKRCERYYEVIVDGSDGIGLQVVGIGCHTYKVDQINMPVMFKTQKRANSPSLEYVSGAYYEMRTHSSTVTTSSMGITGAETGKQNAVPYFNTSGQTEHEGWTMYVQNTAAHMAFSSEL